MPEIAEVETVRRTLKKHVLNKKITNIDIIYPKIVETDLEEFKNNLINNKFIDIKRKGKWLIFELQKYYLLSHLRMEGKFFLKNNKEEKEKHEHIIITFDDNMTLRYHDTRKFGRMALVEKDKLYNYKAIAKQGIEPIDKNLTYEYLKDKLNRAVPIKNLLLDQTIISGLGNIYANEVLFAAKINPLQEGKDLTKKDIENIIKSSNEIIKKAIEMGGTTIKSYTSSLGVTGRFQQELKVHKKEGKDCFNCHNKIERIKVGGRSTYFCPKCQK